MYKRLHPSETAGRGQRLGKTSRFKCKQCGFYVDARKRSNKSPELVMDGVVVTGSVEADTLSIDAKQGCPHCGSFNWSSTSTGYSKQADPMRPRIRIASYRRKYDRF